jgi:hypothetical protein
VTSPYSPLVTDYPTTPDELEAFGEGIPDAGQRRTVIAIARTLRQVAGAQAQADAAMAQARNARQMAAANSRDPRFDTLDERIAGLAAVTDKLASTDAQLKQIADSYAQTVAESATDRAALHAELNDVQAELDVISNDLSANLAAVRAETARAIAAEQANAKAISDEVSRAKTAEAAESSLRQQGDAANAKAVTDEASARQAADTTEASTRAAADTALNTRVAAVEQKNTTQDAALTVNTGNISSLQGVLAALTTRVAAVEAKAITIATGGVTLPAMTGGSTGDYSLTWTRAFVDTNYRIELLPSAALNGNATYVVKSRTTTGAVVTVTATTAVGAGSALDAVAWRFG